jgi:hypothetical protein
METLPLETKPGMEALPLVTKLEMQPLGTKQGMPPLQTKLGIKLGAQMRAPEAKRVMGMATRILL